jgi:hypothetical protein
MGVYRRAAIAAAMVLGCAIAISPSGALAGSHGHGARHGAGSHRIVRTVSFYAHVVRVSSKGLVVQTIDGRTLSFSAKELRHQTVAKHHRRRHGARIADVTVTSGNVVVNILGLAPGTLVQVTETTDASGKITITITLPPPPPPASASGVVSDVGDDYLTLTTSDLSDLRFIVSSDVLANLNLQTCDIVEVTYHQDAGILIADGVTQTGVSTTGDCTPTYDATGVITSISDSSVAINGDQGALSFAVDPSSGLTDGFQPGDLVDVTYTINSDNSLSATDIQFVEEQADGIVTSVGANGTTVTITDDSSGQSETFVADPNNGVQITAQAFNGVSVGDHIDIDYHQSAGKLVADTVTDDGPAAGGGPTGPTGATGATGATGSTGSTGAGH